MISILFIILILSDKLLDDFIDTIKIFDLTQIYLIYSILKDVSIPYVPDCFHDGSWFSNSFFSVNIQVDILIYWWVSLFYSNYPMTRFLIGFTSAAMLNMFVIKYCTYYFSERILAVNYIGGSTDDVKPNVGVCSHIRYITELSVFQVTSFSCTSHIKKLLIFVSWLAVVHSLYIDLPIILLQELKCSHFCLRHSLLNGHVLE